jgi:hypothetical protein
MKKEIELLQECKLQLEYLNEKFGETGTTNALLTKIDVVLRQPDVIKSVCYCTEAEYSSEHDCCGKCKLPVKE